MTRGIHSKANKGETVDWLTPMNIVRSLGDFDLDPCGFKNWPTAKKMYCLPEDGLALPWSGRVWLNPPYGTKESNTWLRKMSNYGVGTALLASRTETAWFHDYVWEAATAVLFLRGRLSYYKPDFTQATGNAGHGSALVAYGEDDAAKLLISKIDGRYLYLNN